MQRSLSFQPGVSVLAGLLACLALGCTEKPKPPTVNLFGHQGLAMLPFRNTSSDAALAGAVTDELLAGLNVLKPMPVTGPAVTGALAPEATLIPDAALGAKLAATTGCDLVMTGAVAGYRETVKAVEPKRIKASYRAGSWKWGCTDDAVVNFLVTVRLAEAVSGREVWLKTVTAEGKSSRWTDLSYDGEETKPPKDGWDAIRLKSGVPALALTTTATGTTTPQYAMDTNLAHARAEAIAQVTRAVLNDFTGRGGWKPPAGPARP